ncbi:TerD family protein [Frankia sp. CNm7]|uniref:TerD family protein n=1 Tax=Frankia nepalensis TaxID=1836974 RepID=A0A937R6M2_9ACTN|nr:TerD family protein [Frankia nepalensis]MBL7498725.1 TerD family protein [Frankia nepalensis]MBL7508410.1 TerD family protein [Frankia nepalensis]MBL7517410.1 TerD family protein [Frankia nepalensis]MBL7626241.1 TerD family protein [Frankia nepalensis]
MAAALALTAGANLQVPTRTVRLSLDVRGGPDVDVCAVLLTASGQVRSDADLVFFNQPVHPSGAVRISAGSFAAALATVEPAIDVIVLAGSVDAGTFLDVSDLRVNLLEESGRPLACFTPNGAQPVTTMVFGELYRRGDGWKFRAVGQGWDSGLAGLARNYGIQVDDDAPAPEPAPSQPRPPAARPATPSAPVQPVPAARAPTPAAAARADWHPDPTDPSCLRWWDGSAWADHRIPAWRETDSTCGGCGGPKRRQMFRGAAPCAACESRIHIALLQWQHRLSDVLTQQGATKPALDALWAELRFQRVPEGHAYEMYRRAGLGYLERIVAFAYADGVIEQHELAGFNTAATALNIQDDAVNRMRARLERGLTFTRIRDGDLPRIQNPMLHLELDEIMHLDAPATHVRQLANGARRTEGRLIASSKKLRFISPGAGGSETPWAKVHAVMPCYGGVDISTTTRTSGTYLLADPEYAAAVLSGTLRVAKRLVLAPGQRDTRTIPPDVKAAVWQRDGGACSQCRATEYLEFDHVIPHSLGGATSVGNLQLLCRRCNQEKGARI